MNAYKKKEAKFHILLTLTLMFAHTILHHQLNTRLKDSRRVSLYGNRDFGIQFICRYYTDWTILNNIVLTLSTHVLLGLCNGCLPRYLSPHQNFAMHQLHPLFEIYIQPIGVSLSFLTIFSSQYKSLISSLYSILCIKSNGNRSSGPNLRQEYRISECASVCVHAILMKLLPPLSAKTFL